MADRRVHREPSNDLTLTLGCLCYLALVVGVTWALVHLSGIEAGVGALWG